MFCASIVFDVVYSYRCILVSRQMRKRSTHLLGRAKAEHTAALSPAPGHSAIIFTGPLAKAHATRRTRSAHAPCARVRQIRSSRARAQAPPVLLPQRSRSGSCTSRGADSDGTAGTACGGESRTAQQRPTEKGQTGGGPVANICTLPAGRPRPLSSPGRVLCNKSGERSVLVRVGHPCCYSAICVDG